MIRIFLGGVGSGKTACAVMDMMEDKSGKITYSNIVTKGIRTVVPISSDMIVKKEIVKTITRKDGKTEPVYKMAVNKEFWQTVKKPCSVTLDECHTILNARNSMSGMSKKVTEWLALLRRVLCSKDGTTGHLTMISQLDNRIDIIARDMATNVRYHRCHYMVRCRRCGSVWQEHNDIPEPAELCVCGEYRLERYGHVVEVWHFVNISMYQRFIFYGERTFHSHYVINNISDVFGRYDTLQWDNLISD